MEHQFFISPQIKTEYDIPLTSKINLLFEAGVNLESSYGKFQFELFNNSQLNGGAQQGVYIFTNLNEGASKTGTYKLNGGYRGIGIAFSPRKKIKKVIELDEF